ncbi:MAG: hypothetical protein QGF38_12675 [Rhodospirillales bacterium]|nr:hypothetical protein [Rhodospirillales bacterium]
MPNAPVKRPRRSTGNAAVVLLGDSRMMEFTQMPETMFAALGHFGMPYRLFDLARRRPTSRDLAGAAAIIIGQENLGLSIDAAEQGLILSAVKDGTGLVNFDCNLANYDDAFTDALGLAAPGKRFEIDGVSAIGITGNEHTIANQQENTAHHRLHVPLAGVPTRAKGTETTVLAECESGAPAVIATTIGRGRAVQWLVSPRLWTLRHFGHAHGLDDLFWRGIVWTARKPFAMLAMPPFVRLRFDDCNGLWRGPEDLAFIDVLNRHGHTPNICLCMKAVTGDGWGAMKRLYDEGRAEFAPHIWKGGVSLFYGDEDGEYSTETFRELISETKTLFAEAGITPSKILSDHNHECSSRVLPFLAELGIEYKMNIMLPGETRDSVHIDWRPLPYGSMSYAFDTMPGPYPLFAVFNHHPHFGYSHSYIARNRFVSNRDGGPGPYKWDFLNGLTKSTLGANDLNAMARRMADHTRLGVNSLFFGGSISHSHFTTALTPGEWDEVLVRYEALTNDMETINAGYDHIAAYARSRFHTHLDASTRRGNDMAIKLAGEARVPLELSVYHDRDNGIERQFKAVKPFSGRSETLFTV